MRRVLATATATAAVLFGTALMPTAATAHPTDRQRCTPVRSTVGFYEAGVVATEEMTVPANPRCTTISVSHIRDPRVPGDHCQTFYVGFWPVGSDGSLTYTDRIEACAAPGDKPVVIATNVPDGARFIVLYQIDYNDPEVQNIRFSIWR